MEFKVSKKKFLKNELFKNILVINVVILMFSFSFYLAFGVFLGSGLILGLFITVLVFIYKNNHHYRDLLYIKEELLNLKKEIVYIRNRYVEKIEKIEYNVIKIENFKENSNQFVLYGKIEMKKTIMNSKFLGNFDKMLEECKIVEKMIIRKNFEKEKEIRESLKCLVDLHKNNYFNL